MIQLMPILEENSKEPLYIQLYQYIRDEIVSGRIQEGTRLPSVRQLSASLEISRTPVADCYELLLAEGYITSKPRSGFYVIPFQEHLTLTPRTELSFLKNAPQTNVLDFHYDKVDLIHFPYKKWNRLNSSCVTPENLQLLQYGDLQGEPGLRSEIASYLHQLRGVRCTPDQIIVGAGTYHSLGLLFQLLKDEVAIVGTEEAVNVGVQDIFNQFPSISFCPLTLEKDGISIDDLYASRAQAVYVTPSHQFPFGMTLSKEKRMELLQWSKKQDGYIIENDYDGEFRYNNRPLPSLQSLDEHEKVIYLGTFSRVLTPHFRISYLVLPHHLMQHFRQKKHSYNQLSSPILQMTLQLFMESQDFASHIRKMRSVYQRKYEILLHCIHSTFGQGAEIIGQGSGLHLLLKVRNEMSESQLISAARREGVNVYPTSVYWLNAKDAMTSTVLVGFGGLSEEDIQAGFAKLGKAWGIQAR
ncbi:PLP-dependent aminotransferase family protein [Paenibacillus fonticola]|uniref:MocR-like pyridoxine biosynthesis transcription factor PdxR n=1 Tax=Paenibacillus fonticola TaxID=379896 RepID=UPI00037C10F6|nr:PLP-dependent aminotransferase family protein [Paenibacillus fonticola]